MTMTTPIYTTYGPHDVERLLDYPGCIAAMRGAMIALSTDRREQPLRNITALAPARLFALMPGVAPLGADFGAKVISAFGDPERPGRSSHQGVVIRFDGTTGAVTAVGDAGAITEVRTACASAVATDILARRDASRLLMIGCGAQARTHIKAISLVRKLDRVEVWGRAPAPAARFAAAMAAETGIDVRAITDCEAAAAAADIICTVTGSPEPVLFGAWVKPGTHVNAVGSSHAGPVEVDDALVVASRYIVDYRRSALAAAAEYLHAREAGLVDETHIVGEIGEVLGGGIAGRRADTDITMYKSLGHIAQDLAALGYMHEKATAAGGTRD